MNQKITDTLNNNYMPYAMSVIVSRAIPEIDGLKPSHRKLLYTMYKMGLLKGQKTKSANVVGQTMKLNPHGDMAIYQTLVRLTTGNGALLHPLIESKGNFGKCYSRDMQFAAPRYTEVKLTKLCEELFKDIDKENVDFVDNYDGTLKEPTLLPVTFPNILVNANQGIAVGMASNICSFNLKEICRTTIECIRNNDTDIIEYLKAPDFPTGGELIYNESQMRQIYETGRGSFTLRAKYRVDKANGFIEVYEIPYTTTAEAIIDEIISAVKQGKIKDINDVRDETDLNGLKVTIDIKKSSDPDNLMKRLFKFTSLQSSFSCNFNLLIKGKPMVLGVKSILNEWVSYRIECIKRQIKYDIDKKKLRLHLLLGLEKILLDIDKAIKIIRQTELDSEVIPNIMKGFSVDKAQAEFIAEIKLRNLNREYIINRTSDIDKLKNEIEELKLIFSDELRIKDIIINQLEDISKRYGFERKTQIIQEDEIEEIKTEHLIEDYNVKLFMTEQGYIKKISLVSLRSSGDHKLKEGDNITQEIDARNKSELLLFTDKSTVYKIKAYELEDSKASSLGDYLPNVLKLEEDEKIIYLAAIDNFDGGYMFFAFENGKAAKIPIKSYDTKTNRKKLANAYSILSPLVFIKHLHEDVELVAFSNIDKVLIFTTENINPKSSRDSQGVQVLKSKKGSFLYSIKEISQVDFADLEYYRTKNIPATGCYIKDEDKKDNQITLEI